MGDRTYVVRLSGDASDLGGSAAAAAAQVDKLGSAVDGLARRQASTAAATGSAVQGLAAMQRGGKATGQQMVQLSNQVQDFAVQVASGQSAMVALVQQGSQLSAVFGGFRPALAAIGSLFTAANVAIAGGAAVVGGLAYAYSVATDRQREFARYQVLTGNSAGVTAAQIGALSERIAAETNTSIASVRELLVAYADTGRVGPEALESVARVTSRVAQISGQSADDIRKQFDGLFDNPARGAAQLNARYNFLTAETARLIVKLQEQGEKERAVKLVTDELDKALQQRSKTIGTQIGLWERLKKAASDAFDGLVRSFDAPTLQDQTREVVDRIRTEREALAEAQKRLSESAANSPGQRAAAAEVQGRERAIASLTKRYHELFDAQKQQAVAEKESADAAAKATAERTKVADILGEAGKKAKKPKAPPEDFLGDAQRKLEDRLREGFDRIAESEDKARARELEKDIENYRRRSEAGARFGEQLRDNAEVINIGLIADREARGRAAIDFERRQALERLDTLQLEADEYSRLWEATQTFVAARNAQLTEELKPEWQRQLEAWRDTNQLMRESFDSFQEGWLRSGEEAWVEFVQTGKLNAKSMVDFVLAELARLQFRQQFAGGFSALGQALAGFFTGGSAGVGSSGAAGTIGGSSVGAIIASARGNAFSQGLVQGIAQGQVHALARGGVLGPNGGLLTQPTVFPMRNGGVAIGGEAGTEAVMPLGRDARGRLGVRVAGGGGQPAPQVNVAIYGAPSQPTVRQRPNGQGGVDIEVVFEQFRERLIGDVNGGGPFGGALEGQYGVNRAQGLVR